MIKRINLPNGGWMIEYEHSGKKEWFNQNGKLHRLDGPAVERIDGSKQWYFFDKIFVQRKRM